MSRPNTISKPTCITLDTQMFIVSFKTYQCCLCLISAAVTAAIINFHTGIMFRSTKTFTTVNLYLSCCNSATVLEIK